MFEESACYQTPQDSGLSRVQIISLDLKWLGENLTTIYQSGAMQQAIELLSR